MVVVGRHRKLKRLTQPKLSLIIWTSHQLFQVNKQLCYIVHVYFFLRCVHSWNWMFLFQLPRVIKSSTDIWAPKCAIPLTWCIYLSHFPIKLCQTNFMPWWNVANHTKCVGKNSLKIDSILIVQMAWNECWWLSVSAISGEGVHFPIKPSKF